MNLKLIEKLVKLANHNPNENEANSAARRVCKLIEEANFDYRATISDASTLLGKSPIQPTTWNDIRRSKEPFWKSKPPKEPKTEPFQGRQRAGKSNPFTHEWTYEPVYEPFFTDFINRMRRDNPFDPINKSKPFSNTARSSTGWDKDKAPIKKCEKCGKEYKSPRIVNVCADCQWKEAFEEHYKNGPIK